MRRLPIVVVVLLSLTLAAIGLAAIGLLNSGLSARPDPPEVEALLARRFRSMALPGSARSLADPGPETATRIAAGRAHFADHCAVCHANDGSGRTELGRHLYPRAPDMRLPTTQRLSDGELFWIIENGVRMTGMPAWGDGSRESQAATWTLVRFIRTLPRLTAEEEAEMARLNPKTAEEWRELQEEEEFLGSGQQAPPLTAPHP